MALYLVSYNFGDNDKFEYGPLWSKLKLLKATRILHSEWVIAADVGQASFLYGTLSALTSEEDKLMVHELTKDAVWNKILISDTDFRAMLRKHARG